MKIYFEFITIISLFISLLIRYDILIEKDSKRIHISKLLLLKHGLKIKL